MGSAFSVRVAVARHTSGFIGFGTGVNPVQHVFDMGEGLEGLAVFQHSTGSTTAVGSVATGAGTIVFNSDGDWTAGLGLLRLETPHIHE